jgi:hypothetical protein
LEDSDEGTDEEDGSRSWADDVEADLLDITVLLCEDVAVEAVDGY